MTAACKHDRVRQFSTIDAVTDWSRAGVSHLPDDAPCTEVLYETTERWECADCGVAMHEDGNELNPGGDE